jgi:hypothetical protein
MRIPKKGGHEGSSRKFPKKCSWDGNSGEGGKIQKTTAREGDGKSP